MERVSILVQKLQQQIDNHATAEELMLTVQLLQTELNNIRVKDNPPAIEKVFVMAPTLPVIANEVTDKDIKDTAPTDIEEKVMEVLQVNEQEIEEELNEIKKNAEAKNRMSSQAHRPIDYDPIEDIPTMIHQPAAKPEEDSPAGNIKKGNQELHEELDNSPIKDLRKAIDINDRYLFINDLFRGDEPMYERSIKTVNNFSIYGEAEYWIRRELKLKLGWNDSEPTVRKFDHLIRRRFS